VLEGGGERRHGGVTRRRLGFGWLAGDGRDRRVAGCWRRARRRRAAARRIRVEDDVAGHMAGDTWGSCAPRARDPSQHRAIYFKPTNQF
jgi:hypothetical protein